MAVPRFDEQAGFDKQAAALLARARVIEVEVLDAEATVDQILGHDLPGQATAEAGPGRGHLARRWAVVMDRTIGRPIAVVPPPSREQIAELNPHESLRVAAPGSDFLVADVTMTFRSVLAQAEEFELLEHTAVLIVNMKASVLVGLSSVGQVRSDFSNVPVLGVTTLPGRPHIPALVRRCTYRESQVGCPHTETFQTKPFVMPQCRNPLQLNSHLFHW